MGTQRLSDFRTQVKHLIQLSAVDDSPVSLTDAALDAFLAESVVEHSRYRPRLVTDVTLDGDGSAYQFRLDNLTVAFEEGFSELQRVEYPTGSNPPEIVDPNTYLVDRNSSGQTALWFLEDTPVSGTNNIRLEYTVRHTVSDSANTITDAEFYAVCHLASSYALLALAHKNAHRVQADDVGNTPPSIAAAYRTNARAERIAYFAHYGQTERNFGTPAPATVTKEQDLNLAHGADRLFHRRAWY